MASVRSHQIFLKSSRATTLGIAAGVLIGCTANVPYRDLGFDGTQSCSGEYAKYDRANSSGPFPPVDTQNPCWRGGRENHNDYDLLFIEFDDQGWVQGSSKPRRTGPDYLTGFMSELDRLYDENRARETEHGLSVVIYLHGWHHNADAADQDVHSFRRMLQQIVAMEQRLHRAGYMPMRVVGIYVGWRGESVTIPFLRKFTFWSRKSAAERVAQGSVRELLKRLDQFRDKSRARSKTDDGKEQRNVRMLTIGHSFGGLITFESLSSEFLRYAVRFKEVRQDKSVDPWMSRVGDLVVIVNPAFEGSRYEPLRAASARLGPVEERQLPVLIVATSEGDWATKYAFRYARAASTVLEMQPDDERDANVKAVGHNSRYATHELGLGACEGHDKVCSKACRTQPPADEERIQASVSRDILEAEYDLMRRIEHEGVSDREYLCGGMELRGTDRWQPSHNPFWVVHTTEDVIRDHGDIFNPRFVSFLRQMYLGFIIARFPSRGK